MGNAQLSGAMVLFSHTSHLTAVSVVGGPDLICREASVSPSAHGRLRRDELDEVVSSKLSNPKIPRAVRKGKQSLRIPTSTSSERTLAERHPEDARVRTLVTLEVKTQIRVLGVLTA